MNGVPQYTFVEPEEYGEILTLLRSPNVSCVLEGPTGSGKTTLLRKALSETKQPFDWFDAGVPAQRQLLQSQLASLASGGRLLAKHLIVDDSQALNAAQLASAAQAIYTCSLHSQNSGASGGDAAPRESRGQAGSQAGNCLLVFIGLPGLRAAILDHSPRELRSSMPKRLRPISMASRFTNERFRRLERLLVQGEQAANIKFAQPDELIRESGGAT